MPWFPRGFGAEWAPQKRRSKRFSSFFFKWCQMSHYVYIIYSSTRDKYYVGESVNPLERIIQHNSGHYTGSSTEGVSDWSLFFSIKCNSRSQALRLERFIKKMKSRQFYHRLKSEPDLVEGLLKKTR